ncbi:MAG: AI-2E family transporter [Sulfurovum sp.]|nr:AI-2E family transporter [Sulfurovum sp.]MCB4760706.1 AI-2E family transporter [Sulfurovum sp.]MCB4775942.1 AI-2E family transporter [Sulfurovum sp.]MCB4779943.1 AI-2E family transporter [Sulfurovum sp.]MCB4783339.1 AI-2E family transporter [Sulfurovum sp.]
MTKTQLMITALFILGLMGAYSVYQPFLLSMAVAVLLSMATFNLTKHLTDFTNCAKISSGISTLLMTLLLFVPIVYLATIGVSYIAEIDKQGVQETLSALRVLVQDIPFFKEIAYQYMSDEHITKYIQESTTYATMVGGKGLGFMKNMLFVVFFYFFINYYGNRFFDTILELLPVTPQKGEKIIKEISTTMEIVFYSVIVTAIFEGFLFGAMMSYFGFNGIFFGVIYGFASLVPIIGGVIVWVPVSLYVWTKIDTQIALMIASYSVIVVSIVADTFVKPMIIEIIKKNFLKSALQINSILIFFSIFAGMNTYGFWGMILGPAITSFLIAITKVYLNYSEENEED